jgi:hypothetical protein
LEIKDPRESRGGGGGPKVGKSGDGKDDDDDDEVEEEEDASDEVPMSDFTLDADGKKGFEDDTGGTEDEEAMNGFVGGCKRLGGGGKSSCFCD